MYSLASTGSFILVTILSVVFWLMDVIQLGDHIHWSAVIAVVVIVLSYYFAQRYKPEPHFKLIAIISFSLQVFLLVTRYTGPVPFQFHIVGGGVTALLFLVLPSIEVPRLATPWHWFRSALMYGVLLSWLPFFFSSSFGGSRADTWFRVSHGFYPFPPVFMSGMGGTTSQVSSLHTERKDGKISFNGRGSYDGELASGAVNHKPILVSINQFKDCIDGFGDPYFRDKYSRHRFFEISECSQEKNDTAIVLEGTTYKLVRMDGSEVRTLPYEVIDLDPRIPGEFSPYGFSEDALLPARRNGLWGLIDLKGEERLAPMSKTRPKSEYSGFYRITQESGVGLAGPGRGMVLPPIYKEFSVALSGVEGNSESKSLPELLKYSGVIWVKTQSDEWGLFAANQDLWLITPGKLIQINARKYDFNPVPSINVAKFFRINQGFWLFMDKPVAKMQGMEFTFDFETRTFVPPPGIANLPKL
jgi:hypothetical protein